MVLRKQSKNCKCCQNPIINKDKNSVFCKNCFAFLKVERLRIKRNIVEKMLDKVRRMG